MCIPRTTVSAVSCLVVPAFICIDLLISRVLKINDDDDIWDQCKKKYNLRTDRPAPVRRPTNNRPHNFDNFKRPHLREGLSDPLHVWFYGGGFEVSGSNVAISGSAKSKMAARPPSWKIQMAISPQRIIRFTPCLVLGWGFRGRRNEGR